MIPVSIIAKSSAKNTGAMRANSTTVDPSRSHHNLRSENVIEAVEAEDDTTLSLRFDDETQPGPYTLWERYCQSTRLVLLDVIASY